MTDKKSQKPFSSRNPPVKPPTVKSELVTPSQLVTYDPHQITPVNSPVKPLSSRMVSLGKPIQQSLSFSKALTSNYDPFAKKLAVPPPTALDKKQYAKTSPYLPL